MKHRLEENPMYNFYKEKKSLTFGVLKILQLKIWFFILFNV